MSNKQNKNTAFELTPDIVTNLDLGRVIREAEKLDDFLLQARLKSPGMTATLPKTIRALEQVAETNGLSLLNATHRKHLIGNLHQLKLTSKKVHISFAVEPSPAVMQKIVAWFRSNVQKDLIIEVGIQPTISVGCVVRTTNKVFDMSLRHRFKDSKKVLSDLLEKTG
ncbi:MAG TPA: F0F1 ATP synthase subunit delta [Candidatus Saccharimonadales bacterium]|nr:F0F1 ATP synthase subunit delta [Candidatus Saccharimonadales bacterium]